MDQNHRKLLSLWLFTTSFFVIAMVVFGGYVRLTRSGLSIVEWDVVTGVLPPIGVDAWEETFAKYRQTPEYQKINRGMSLAEYKLIFYREYIHRLLGRLTGLIFVGPLLYFLLKGIIPLKQAGVYLGIGLLFALQGFMGWYMVSSGLVDAPNVSHYRLTVHLLLALALLALCFWTGLNHLTEATAGQPQAGQERLFSLSLILMLVILIQISYGGLVAGLKAGHVSNTFPLIFGYLIPPGLLSSLQPWPLNLVAHSVTVHFLHRWFAFVVLAVAGLLYYRTRQGDYPAPVRTGATLTLAVTIVQILLGLGVIWWFVPTSLALIHQATAVVLFMVVLFMIHRLRIQSSLVVSVAG